MSAFRCACLRLYASNVGHQLGQASILSPLGGKFIRLPKRTRFGMVAVAVRLFLALPQYRWGPAKLVWGAVK